MEVRDTVAIVTGAAGGIGEALTHRFLEAGARVLVSDIDVHKLHATAGRLERVAGAGTVAAVAGDAADPGTIGEMVAVAERELGPVDIFVANAGVGEAAGLAADEDQWRLGLEVNLLAHVRAARVMVPGWLERGGGYFVSTASAAGLLTQIGSAVYSVTKHGAVGFAEWLAVTYGDKGIGVSCLCPMGVDTDLLNGGLQEDAPGGGQAARAVTGAGAVLDPRTVAEDVLVAISEERFLILPHPEVREFARRKSEDPDRWIRGMQRYARTLAEH